MLDNVVLTLSAFSGLLMENTTRGFGWRFLEIGRRMERALQTAELLRCSLGSAAAELEPCLQVLLQIADSSITYRMRYPTVLQTDLVLQLLLADESNPRSVGFQLATLLHQINRLQENEEAKPDSTERDLALKAVSLVRSSQHGGSFQARDDGNFGALEEIVDQLKTTLWELSDTLTARYFSNLISLPPDGIVVSGERIDPMLFQVTHTTRYIYETPVSHCLNEVRLTPRSLPCQEVRETAIRVHPEPAFIHHRKDYYGNDVTSFEVLEKHDRLEATAESIVEVRPEAAESLPAISWEEARERDRRSIRRSLHRSFGVHLQFTVRSGGVATGRIRAEDIRPATASARIRQKI